jgi:hypothetical protein
MRRELRAYPPELQTLISDQVFIPEVNTVRVIWHAPAQKWTYRTIYPPNKIPFAAVANNPAIRACASHLHAAPTIDGECFRSFDYKLDTLKIEYNRCGDSPEDILDHDTAITRALRRLRFSRHARRQLQNLHIVFCNRKIKAVDVLKQLRRLRALKHVTLQCHNHFSPVSRCVANLVYECEREFMEQEAAGFPFEDYDYDVAYLDFCGEDYVAGVARDNEE